MGSQKWINSEIVIIIDTVDILLPAGIQKRGIVLMLCHKSDKKWYRNGENYKRIFEKLAIMKNLIDTAQIPLSVLRDKLTKEKTYSNESIRFCEENESYFDGLSDAEVKLHSVAVSK